MERVQRQEPTVHREPAELPAGVAWAPEWSGEAASAEIIREAEERRFTEPKVREHPKILALVDM